MKEIEDYGFAYLGNLVNPDGDQYAVVYDKTMLHIFPARWIEESDRWWCMESGIIHDTWWVLHEPLSKYAQTSLKSPTINDLPYTGSWVWTVKNNWLWGNVDTFFGCNNWRRLFL